MILLTSTYLGPVHYYTKLYSGEPIIEERADHYVKQTYRNRCIIAGDDGPLALTVPVEGMPCGTSKTPMHAIRISDHGKWRHQHWQAIVSAYESSPFFEYYADEFETVFSRPYEFLVDFNHDLQQLVLDLLELHPSITVNDGTYLNLPEAKDFRETIRPKIAFDFDPDFRPVPYYQVFRSRHGFLPNLSIIDLLFNMGPESRLILKQSSSVLEAPASSLNLKTSTL